MNGPMKIDSVRKLAEAIITDRAKTISLAKDVDDAYYLNYSLPKEFKDVKWLTAKKSTDPHDAIRSARRALSAIEIGIDIDPHLSDPRTRGVNEVIEKWLGKCLKSHSERRETGLLEDWLQSAFSYDFIVTHVNNLAYFYDENTLNGLSEAEQIWIGEEMEYNPYSFKVFHPEAAFPRITEIGLQGILTRKTISLEELRLHWGNGRTKQIREKGDKEEVNYCTVYDYTDLNYRYVWAAVQESKNVLSRPQDGQRIYIGKRQETFLPWVVSYGGTDVTRTGLNEPMPLLRSIIDSGQWKDQCLLESVEYSLVTALAAYPAVAVKNSSGEVYRIEYWNPFKILTLRDGDELIPLELNTLDPALGILADKEAMKMEKSTISRVLQGAPPPGGVAFSSMNLASQTAAKTLNEGKKLAERHIAKVCQALLKWQKFLMEDIKVPGYEDVSYTLIQTNCTIKVTLTEDVPTDHMARAQVGSVMTRELGYSKRRALQQMNEADPDAIFNEAALERLRENEEAAMLEGRYNRALMKQQLESAGLGQLAQLAEIGEPNTMQFLQALNEQLAQAAAGETAQPPATPMPGEEGMMPEGQMLNPAMGMMPPINAMGEEATFEGATGTTRQGEEIEE
jgi:hypothetical protein